MASFSPSEENSNEQLVDLKFRYGDDDAPLTEPEMWIAIEKEIGVLPTYLKNILIINGFNHLLSLEELDETAIDEMERFAKESMQNYVPNTEEYFYIFKTNPSDFRILSGHRKLLLKLKDRIRKNGINYYTQFKLPPMMELKPERLFFSDDIQNSPTTQAIPTSTPTPPRSSSPVSVPPKLKRQKRNHIPEIYNEDDKIRLLVYNWFTKYTDKVLNLSSINAVVCDNDDKVYGIIICPVCSTQVKIGSEKNKNGSNRWIISNYVKHFHKYHSENFSNGCKIEIP